MCRPYAMSGNDPIRSGRLPMSSGSKRLSTDLQGFVSFLALAKNWQPNATYCNRHSSGVAFDLFCIHKLSCYPPALHERGTLCRYGTKCNTKVLIVGQIVNHNAEYLIAYGIFNYQSWIRKNYQGSSKCIACISTN